MNAQAESTTRPTNVHRTGFAAVAVWYLICLVALVASAILLNVFIDANIYMWLMVLFGAVVITTLISAAAIPYFRAHPSKR